MNEYINNELWYSKSISADLHRPADIFDGQVYDVLHGLDFRYRTFILHIENEISFHLLVNSNIR